jgi:hypothetical protein
MPSVYARFLQKRSKVSVNISQTQYNVLVGYGNVGYNRFITGFQHFDAEK